MGFLSGLFGKSPKVGRVETLSKEQRAALNSLLSEAQRALGTGYWPGAEKAAAWYETMSQPYRDPSFIEAAFDPEKTKKYWTEHVLPAFQQEIIPQIKASFAGPGYWGTARARAEQEAYQSMGDQLAQALYQEDLSKRMAMLDWESAQRQTLLQMLREGAITPQDYARIVLGAVGIPTYAAAVSPGTTGLLGGMLQGAGLGLGQYLGSTIFR